MTREEAKQKIYNASKKDKSSPKNCIHLLSLHCSIDQIFDYFGEQLQDKDDEIELLKCRIEEAMKPKTCSLCIFWDTARPRSHPNYAECNNRKCPLSYMEVHYEFGCKMFVPKDNA